MNRLLITLSLMVAGSAFAGDWTETWNQREFFVLNEGQPDNCARGLVFQPVPWNNDVNSVRQIDVKFFGDHLFSNDVIYGDILSFMSINSPPNRGGCSDKDVSKLERNHLVRKRDVNYSNSHIFFDTCKHSSSTRIEFTRYVPDQLVLNYYTDNDDYTRKPFEKACRYQLVPNPQK